MNKNDIAIIGISFEFPGCNELSDLWKNLLAGRCTYTNHYQQESGKVMAWGGVQDIAGFDYYFFDYSYKEACVMDPQHRHLLQHSYWALENSGYIQNAVQYNIGVYASASINRYFTENLCGQIDPDCEDNIVLGNTPDFLATRIAYKLGLTGPAMTIQTGCSSSLVNLHQARIALLTGQCDMALVGAVSLSAPNDQGYSYIEGGIRSKNGECRPFDNEASGTIFTNGVAVLVLKRYTQAVQDKDKIYGVIAASAINNDGNKKASFSAPNISQQAATIEKACRVAKIDKSLLKLLEAHGTGTAIGDPIEFEALTQVLPTNGNSPWCALQSVKANFGHMDTASGLAGIIKACLVLQHRLLPPQAQFNSINQRIPLSGSAFYINTEVQSLPPTGTYYAGVTALGIGGTNAHVLLKTPEEVPSLTSNVPEVVLISAHDEPAFKNKIKNLIDFCQKKNPDLSDLACATQFYQESMPYRFGCYVEDMNALLNALRQAKLTQCSIKTNAIAFMFPGQGSQYVNMGWQLYQNQSFFRQKLDEYFAILRQKTTLDYHRILFCDENNQTLYQTYNTQVVLMAFEVAMADYFMSLGIMPAVLIGHSLGEYSALVVSGALDFEQAASMVIKRASLMATTEKGMMLSVFCDEDTLKPFLSTKLNVAAVNAPTLTTVSGEISEVEQLAACLQAHEIVCQPLMTEYGFHSHLLDGILNEFAAFVKTMQFNKPQVPIISNVHGAVLTYEELKCAEYWVKQMRQPVLFKQGIEFIDYKYAPLYVEVGPGQTLTTLCKQIQTTQPAIQTLPHPKQKKDIWKSLYSAFAKMWQHGTKINWNRVRDDLQTSKTVTLPPYPFTKKRCWLEPPVYKQLNTQGLQSYTRIWQQYLMPPTNNINNYSLLLLYDHAILETLHSKKQSLTYPFTTMQWREDASFVETVNEAIQSLGECYNQPVILINLLALHEVDSFCWEQFQQKNLNFLNQLAQRIEKQEGSYLKKMLLVTNHAIDLQSEIIPEKSVLQSIVKTINQEQPKMDCLLLDMDVGYSEALELALPDIEPLVALNKPMLAYRNGSYFCESFIESKIPSSPAELKKALNHVIIIGGVGNVGLQYVQALKSTVNKLTIIQRRHFNQLIQNHRHQAFIRQLGEEPNCQFIQADVGHYQELANGLKKAINYFGAADLLIHTAGVDASMHYRLMRDLTPDFVSECFYAKRLGLMNLARLSEELKIKHIHVVSSISSVLAGIGMYIYAGLHAYIDNFVIKQNRLGKSTWSSINWEAWEFGNTEDEPELFQQGAFGGHLDSLAMSVEKGQTIIKKWLTSQSAAVIISNGDLLTRYQNWVEKDGFGLSEKQIKDERPPLTIEYVQPGTQAEIQLMAVWSDILGIDEIGIHDNFFELGGHSLMALQLASQMSKKFNKPVSVVDLFAYPTIAKLAEYLSKSQADKVDNNLINKRVQARNKRLKQRKQLKKRCES